MFIHQEKDLRDEGLGRKVLSFLLDYWLTRNHFFKQDQVHAPLTTRILPMTIFWRKIRNKDIIINLKLSTTNGTLGKATFGKDESSEAAL